MQGIKKEQLKGVVLMYQINGRIVSNEDKIIRFRHRVREAIPLDDRLIVLLDVPDGDKTTDNICCIDRDLKVVWRASPLKKKYPDIQVYPYEEMLLDDGLLIAFDFLGRRFQIDLKTGEVLRYTFSK